MKRMNTVVSNEKGFTLVEIIAVLVILGILAAVAVPKFFDMQASAEKKTLLGAFNDMNSRMNAAFSKSMLDHNGVAVATEFDSFGELGLADAAAITAAYKDFSGTWAGGGAGNITYTAANGGVVYTFSITAGSGTAPGTINVSPALK